MPANHKAAVDAARRHNEHDRFTRGCSDAFPCESCAGIASLLKSELAEVTEAYRLLVEAAQAVQEICSEDGSVNRGPGDYGRFSAAVKALRAALKETV